MARCREYLSREWDLLQDLRAVLVLGKLAQDALLVMLREKARVPPRKGFAFGHGVVHDLGEGLQVFASYHPSQQNTFTGKLKPADLDAVLAAVNRHLGRKDPRRNRA
jgi:uracil-DNA glycosylase